MSAPTCNTPSFGDTDVVCGQAQYRSAGRGESLKLALWKKMESQDGEEEAVRQALQRVLGKANEVS